MKTPLEQVMDKTLKKYQDYLIPGVENSFSVGYKNGFFDCAQWHQEQVKILLDALEWIAASDMTDAELKGLPREAFLDDVVRARKALSEYRKKMGVG